MSGCNVLNSIFINKKTETALIEDDVVWTYSDLYIAACIRVHIWMEKGLQACDKILLLTESRSEYLISVLACSLGGYTCISINPKIGGKDISYIRQVVRPNFEWNGFVNEKIKYTSKYLDDSKFLFSNIDIIFFTSGTTSHPKGVCHNFEALLSNAQNFNQRVNLNSTVRMLHLMPIGYMAGLLNTFLSPLMAAGIVFLENSFDARVALRFWGCILRYEINSVWLTPTMLATVAAIFRDNLEKENLQKKLKYVFVGTAPLYSSTRRLFEEKVGITCRESYGMTECMLISVDSINQKGSVGKLLDGVKAKINNDGELCVFSPYQMAGYLGGDGKTLVRSVFDDDGYLETGDCARFDEHENLYITDRKKDLIIRGGLNISPKTIEDILFLNQSIKDVAVIGIPHPFWIEELLACIVLKEHSSFDLKELDNHCKSFLHPDSVPQRFIVFQSLPRSSTGKVQKNILREYCIKKEVISDRAGD